MTTIGFIGAGPVARQLGALAAAAGYRPVLSSRSPSAEHQTVDFAEVAKQADVAVVAIPYRAVDDVLPKLRTALVGKIVIDVTNPLHPDYTPIVLGPDTSAGEHVALLLPDSQVVKSVQHDLRRRHANRPASARRRSSNSVHC